MRKYVDTDTIKVVTNHKSRDLKCFHDIPVKHQSDFDYVKDDDRYSLRFFAYRGSWYDSHEFMDKPHVGKWDIAQCESYFSAIYIRFCNDFESVIVGFAHC